MVPVSGANRYVFSVAVVDDELYDRQRISAAIRRIYLMSWLHKIAKEPKPIAIFDSETLLIEVFHDIEHFKMRIGFKTSEAQESDVDARRMVPQLRKFVQDMGELRSQPLAEDEAKWLGDVWASEGLPSEMQPDGTLVINNGFSANAKPRS